MITLGAAIIGFLIGLIFCYWKQIRSLYDNRDAIAAGADVLTGIQGAKELWEKI